MTPATQEQIKAMADYLGPVLTGAACDLMVRQVPVPFLQAVWPDVVERIAGVVERSAGRWTIEDIAGRLLRSDWQLWVVCDGTIRAVLATEIVAEPSGMRNARILFATGSGAERWSHLIEDIEDWARVQGCEKLEMMARKGWARHLKAYKLTHVLLERDLNG